LLVIERGNGFASRTTPIATQEIERNRSHRRVEQGFVVNRMLPPPETNKRFLHDVLGIGAGMHPLPREKNKSGPESGETHFPIFIAGRVLHDLFTVF
jgi:hypothetical protein